MYPQHYGQHPGQHGWLFLKKKKKNSNPSGKKKIFVVIPMMLSPQYVKTAGVIADQVKIVGAPLWHHIRLISSTVFFYTRKVQQAEEVSVSLFTFLVELTDRLLEHWLLENIGIAKLSLTWVLLTLSFIIAIASGCFFCIKPPTGLLLQVLFFFVLWKVPLFSRHTSWLCSFPFAMFWKSWLVSPVLCEPWQHYSAVSLGCVDPHCFFNLLAVTHGNPTVSLCFPPVNRSQYKINGSMRNFHILNWSLHTDLLRIGNLIWILVRKALAVRSKWQLLIFSLTKVKQQAQDMDMGEINNNPALLLSAWGFCCSFSLILAGRSHHSLIGCHSHYIQGQSG